MTPCQLAYMDVVTRFDYDGRPILCTANVEATANDTEVGGSMVDTEERKTVQKKTLWALSSPIHQAYNHVRRRSLPDLESSVRSLTKPREIPPTTRDNVHTPCPLRRTCSLTIVGEGRLNTF